MNESLKLIQRLAELSYNRKINEFKITSKGFAVFFDEGRPFSEIENDFCNWVNQQNFRGEKYFGRDLFKKYINPFQNLLIIARGKASGNGKAMFSLSENPDGANFTVEFKIDLRMFPTIRMYKTDIEKGSLPQPVISFMQDAIPGYKTVLEKELASRLPTLFSSQVDVEYKGLEEIGAETVLFVKLTGNL